MGRIQQEAFDLVAVQHQRTLVTLDQLERDIAQFNANPSLGAQQGRSGSSGPALDRAQIARITVGTWQSDDYDGRCRECGITFQADGRVIEIGESLGVKAEIQPALDENPRWAISQQRRVRYTPINSYDICEAEELTPERMTVACYVLEIFDGYTKDGIRMKKAQQESNLETVDLTKQFKRKDGTFVLLRQ